MGALVAIAVRFCHNRGVGEVNSFLGRRSRRAQAGLARRVLDTLEALDFPLDTPDAARGKELIRRTSAELRSHILPRLASSAMPAIVVLGGATGVGKSTLFNSLAGQTVSPASIVRPTTRQPVALVHPQDAEVLENHPLARHAQIVVSEAAFPGMVLVDSPDIDSIECDNRVLGRTLRDICDLWLFVTTPTRYADAAPWAEVKEALAAGKSVAVIVNRISKASQTNITRELAWKMAGEGAVNTPIFVCDEYLGEQGLMRGKQVDAIRSWLATATRTRLTDSLGERARDQAFADVRANLLELANIAEAQDNSLIALRDKANEGEAAPIDKLAQNLASGRFGQGAPGTTWDALARSGGVLEPLVRVAQGERVGFRARRLTAQRDAALTSLFDTIAVSLLAAITQGLASSSEGIDQLWREDEVPTEELIAKAHANLDISKIARASVEAWKSELMRAARSKSAKPWLSDSGMAALIGVASAGVSGAAKVGSALGVEKVVWAMRARLAELVEGAIEELGSAYAQTITAVPVGGAQALRELAREFGGGAGERGGDEE